LRLIFARMGILLSKCCGNAALKSPAGARPIGGTHATPRKSAKTRLSSRGNIKLAPPISGNGTNAKASDVRFVAALKALKYAALTFAESTPLPPMAVNHVVPVMAKTAQWLP
jgi:hypothetical protein